MDEDLRDALLARQREASRCTRARIQGEEPDEAVLDELDLRLFSPERTKHLALDLTTLGGPARLCARSWLGLALRCGPLSRLRRLDRELAGARRGGQRERVLEIRDEIREQLAREGAFSVPPLRDYLTLSGLVREEDLPALESSARSLLEKSASLAEEVSGKRERTGRMGGEPKRPGGAGRPRNDPGEADTPRHDSFGRGAGKGLDFDEDLDAASIRRALREAAEGLGLERRLPGPSPEDATPARMEPLIGRSLPADRRRHEAESEPGLDPGSLVLEEDPPSRVVLFLPRSSGVGALLRALDAGGRALDASLRSASLPAEHRVHSDQAIGFAIGTLFCSLAGERAPIQGGSGNLLEVFEREILGVRRAARGFIARAALLSGRPPDRSSPVEGEEQAGPGEGPLPRATFEREPLLVDADRLRGALLFAGLRERFRTRFGNLWYREKAVGRILEEVCEPGGSIVAADIMTGLSLPAPSTDNLLETWLQESRRLH